MGCRGRSGPVWLVSNWWNSPIP